MSGGVSAGGDGEGGGEEERVVREEQEEDHQVGVDVVDEEQVPPLPSHYSFKYVCIGGGVAAGYWAHTMVETQNDQAVAIEDRSIAIISTYPKGILPYERPALTKAALNPANHGIRACQSEAFPLTR